MVKNSAYHFLGLEFSLLQLLFYRVFFLWQISNTLINFEAKTTTATLHPMSYRMVSKEE